MSGNAHGPNSPTFRPGYIGGESNSGSPLMKFCTRCQHEHPDILRNLCRSCDKIRRRPNAPPNTTVPKVRFPLQPLLDRLNLPNATAFRESPRVQHAIGPSSAKQLAARGYATDPFFADRLATRLLQVHPALVWPAFQEQSDLSLRTAERNLCNTEHQPGTGSTTG